jgi:AcrR family transcriptional regulator
LFAERGFTSVTTRQIAGAADVAFPIMYRHFGDKRRLYVTAFSDSLEKVNRKYLALLRLEGSPEERLLAFVAELYKDLVSDSFVSRFMQREILDRDYKGLKEMTRTTFLEPYLLVKEFCRQLVGPDAAEWTAILVYAVTMGLSQFRPIGMTISPKRKDWIEPESMARLILVLVFHNRDWSPVGRGNKVKGPSLSIGARPGLGGRVKKLA